MAVVALSGLVFWMLTLAAYVIAMAVTAIGSLIVIGFLNSKAARRAQLLVPLRGSLEDGRPEALASGSKVWAVHAVGRDFHYGPWPRKGADLALLFPSRQPENAQVAVFPDAGRARSAATYLQRNGYSYRELRALFPKNFQERPEAELPVRVATSELLPNPQTFFESIPTPEPSMSAKRDLTQYTFDGQTTGKGRLVLALVKHFVANNPNTTLESLRGAFPDALQADSPLQFSKAQTVVARLDDLDAASHRRYFVDAADRLHLDGCHVVVSREWNLHNIENVLRRAKELGLDVAVKPGVSAPEDRKAR